MYKCVIKFVPLLCENNLRLFSRMRIYIGTGTDGDRIIGCLVRMRDLITVISSTRTENICFAHFTNRILRRSSLSIIPLIHTYVYSLILHTQSYCSMVSVIIFSCYNLLIHFSIRLYGFCYVCRDT